MEQDEENLPSETLFFPHPLGAEENISNIFYCREGSEKFVESLSYQLKT